MEARQRSRSGDVRQTIASDLGGRNATPRPSRAPGMAPMKKPEDGHARREETERSAGVVDQQEDCATRQELGERWHMNGVRVWDWAHNGIYCNGWIQFQAGGRLCTNFGSGKGRWERVDEGTMNVTFGSCIHTLFLSAELARSTPRRAPRR